MTAWHYEHLDAVRECVGRQRTGRLQQGQSGIGPIEIHALFGVWDRMNSGRVQGGVIDLM